MAGEWWLTAADEWLQLDPAWCSLMTNGVWCSPHASPPTGAPVELHVAWSAAPAPWRGFSRRHVHGEVTLCLRRPEAGCRWQGRLNGPYGGRFEPLDEPVPESSS